MPRQPRSSSVPVSIGRILVATGDAGLLDELLRLSAASGVEVEAVPDAAAARRSWSAATGALVGDDLAPSLLLRPPSRREGVVLVGVDQDDASIWRRGVDLGAGHVVFLPDAEPWLVGWLADREDLQAGRGALGFGAVVGVVGGRGGAGASTLSVALGVAAARRQAAVMLVEADPLGGGLDVMVGLEDAEGLRWPDLASSRGRVSTASLRSAVLSQGGLGVLPWARDDVLEVPTDAVTAVLSASARAHDLVIVDLPRSLDPASIEAVTRCSVVYLLVPAEVRAVSSAARVAVALGTLAPRLEVVVRGPAPSGLSGEEIADALDLPLAGEMRAEPRLAAALERGEAPGARPRSPLARLSDRLVEELLAGATASRVA
jgi:secretion/DNA translocation related CpaE-like protein